MDNATARALCAVNKRFYQRCSASFSATRTAPWEGWRRRLEWARKARRAKGAQPADGRAGADADAEGARAGGRAKAGVARGGEDAGAKAALENEDARAQAARGDANERSGLQGRQGGAGAREDARARQGGTDAKTLRPEHARPALSVLDLACGNLRFEAFLAEELADTDLTLHTADDCDALVAGAPWRPNPAEEAAFGNRTAGSLRWRHQSLDVLAALDAEERGGEAALAAALRAPRCDLAVSFGFLHHIPLPRWRQEVLAALAAKVRPGGFVIVSLWRFLENPLLARKAEATHEHGLRDLGLPPLDAGDRLLGWKDEPGAYRYCHSFSDEEIDALAASVAGTAKEAARFRADGRDGALNSYLVLQVE